MKTTQHGKLVDTDMAGNGYHGRCEFCDLPLVTDLGYMSWEGTKCKEREISSTKEIPEEIRNYAHFNGLVLDRGVQPGHMLNPMERNTHLKK